MSPSLRIAHLSDPHFSQVTYNPMQFLSKRWIGNLNLLLFRKRAYQTTHLWHLPGLLSSLDVKSVFITGDFSSTSLNTEFDEGRRFVASFQEKGMQTFTLPGNHDCYTKAVERNYCFYSFLGSQNMKETGIEKAELGLGWWYIGLDCAVASPPFCSYGLLCDETESLLKETLQTIPNNDRVVIGNHFPLFSTGHPRHDLKRATALQNVLHKFPQVKLYLHGHDHVPYIIEKPGFPLVLNAGSCAQKSEAAFYILDLFETGCFVQRLHYCKELSWVMDWQKHYAFRMS